MIACLLLAVAAQTPVDLVIRTDNTQVHPGSPEVVTIEVENLSGVPIHFPTTVRFRWWGVTDGLRKPLISVGCGIGVQFPGCRVIRPRQSVLFGGSVVRRFQMPPGEESLYELTLEHGFDEIERLERAVKRLESRNPATGTSYGHHLGRQCLRSVYRGSAVSNRIRFVKLDEDPAEEEFEELLSEDIMRLRWSLQEWRDHRCPHPGCGADSLADVIAEDKIREALGRWTASNHYDDHWFLAALCSKEPVKSKLLRELTTDLPGTTGALRAQYELRRRRD